VASTLFRGEVLRRQGEAALGEPVQIVPLSQVALTAVLATILVIAIVYAAFAGYSRKATAQGVVTSSPAVVRVLAPRPGTIVEVMVEEGARVAAGQRLFRVVAEETGASGTGSDTAILAALAGQRNVLDEQIRNEQPRVEAEATRLDAQIHDLAGEIDQLENQRRIQSARAVEARGFYDHGVPFRATGVITANEQHNRLQSALTEEQNLASLDERLEARRGELEQARLRLRALPLEAADRLARLRRDLIDNEQRAAEIEGRRRYDVRASIAGRLTSLQAQVGASVDPHIPQLSIVPEDIRFEVDLFVPARAIGFVRPGQPVRLRYEAFPFQRFGTYGGTVEVVAATMLAPKDVTGPVALHEPAYRVKVALARQSIDAFGREVALQPDMTLSADIILEKRLLLEWLFEPLLSARGRLS
jgi:multidrug efflux pump subunit AcrA (membrane-fusion protein)